MTMNPSMTECPRFDSCSAPLCPLDSDWTRRKYRRDEAVCPLVLEVAKDGGADRLRDKLPTVAETVLVASPLMATKYPDIAKRLARASGSRSRIASADAALEWLSKVA